MKNLQFNPYQRGTGMGRDGSKKSKPIPAPPRGAGLKFPPIPTPQPLLGGETRGEQSGEGRVKRGRTKLTSLLTSTTFTAKDINAPTFWPRSSDSFILYSHSLSLCISYFRMPWVFHT